MMPAACAPRFSTRTAACCSGDLASSASYHWPAGLLRRPAAGPQAPHAERLAARQGHGGAGRQLDAGMRMGSHIRRRGSGNHLSVHPQSRVDAQSLALRDTAGMQAVLAVTFPFFALVLAGWLAARSGRVHASTIPGLNSFVLFSPCPACCFASGVTPCSSWSAPACSVSMRWPRSAWWPSDGGGRAAGVGARTPPLARW